MSIILAIDYGIKRTGLAITDPLKIIASSLKTLDTKKLMIFLEYYIPKKKIKTIIIGEPKCLNNKFSYIEKDIQKFIKTLLMKFSYIYIRRIDERFTSKLAKDIIIFSGIKKKLRKNKSLIDKISATLILQSYLNQKKNI